jgi:uncharacterized membrane protein
MAAPAANIALSNSMKWALGGWTFFIFENTILSENRTALIHHLGDDGYHMCYGTLSTLAMGSVGWGYRQVRGAAPLLFQGAVPTGAKVMAFGCLSLGLGMVSQMPPKLQIPVEYYSSQSQSAAGVQSNSTEQENTLTSANQSTTNNSKGGWKVRCPFDFTDNKNPDPNSVHGLERITRHPGLWSFGLIGLGNAFLVPSLPQKVWLSMPLLVALIGGAHTDSRFRRGMGGQLSREYDEITSNVPLLAILTRKQGNVINALQEAAEEVKPLNAAIAVGVAGMWVLTRGRGGIKLSVR